MREAQVLKDQLLDTLARDSAIAPHDMIVMMPDIEAYAPFIEAVFSREPAIPFSISDRRHKTESPTIDAVLKIFAMKGAIGCHGSAAMPGHCGNL
jgi:exodeoxyribonuclease V gamma subunit